MHRNVSNTYRYWYGVKHETSLFLEYSIRESQLSRLMFLLQRYFLLMELSQEDYDGFL